MVKKIIIIISSNSIKIIIIIIITIIILDLALSSVCCHADIHPKRGSHSK